MASPAAAVAGDAPAAKAATAASTVGNPPSAQPPSIAAASGSEAAASSTASASVPATTSVLDTSAAALQLLARQQADYRLQLAQLQQKQEAWRQRNQSEGDAAEAASRDGMKQQLQQKLQQRILERQTTPTAEKQGEAQATGSTAAVSATTTPSATAAQSRHDEEMAAARLTAQTFERVRHEQLQRLQQYQLQTQQQLQQAIAAQADAQRRSSEEFLRKQLLVEQDQLRSLQLREQQNSLAVHLKGSQAVSQTDLLHQQQQVLRQQKLLQEFLQKQQQQQLLVQQQFQHLQSQVKAVGTLAAVTGAQLAPTVAGTVAAPAKKKRKTKMESQMEALVRALARINNAKMNADTALALDKMTTWIHRCLDIELLRFAQRDFPVIESSQRQKLSLIQAWTIDLQAKCESIKSKIAQVIAVLHDQEVKKAASSSIPATASAATAGSQATGTAAGVAAETREHAYSALKAQILYKEKKTKKAASGDGTQVGAKRALHVNTSSPSAAIKKARGVTPATPASTLLAAFGRGSSTTTPTLATPGSAKAAFTAPISPREVQRLFDLDLSTRSSSAPEDADDKLYFPVRVISKVMRRALPGGQAPDRTKKSSSSSSKAARKHANDDDGSSDDEHETAASKPDEDRVRQEESTTGNDSHVRRMLDDQGIKINDDALALMQECATEFVLFLTSEARDHCALENRRKKGPGLSIAGEDVVESMHNLGFTPYAKVLECYNAKIKKLQDAVAQKKLEKKLEKKQAAAAEKATAVAKAMRDAAAATSAVVATASKPADPVKVEAPVQPPTTAAASSAPVPAAMASTPAASTTPAVATSANGSSAAAAAKPEAPASTSESIEKSQPAATAAAASVAKAEL